MVEEHGSIVVVLLQEVKEKGGFSSIAFRRSGRLGLQWHRKEYQETVQPTMHLNRLTS